jgi:hypothetical protein
MITCEIWTIGAIDSEHYILVRNGLVINGAWSVGTDRKNNTITIEDDPTKHEAHYLGMIEDTGDYNHDIWTYMDTRKTLK